jgi:hypothetical protein
VGRDVRPAGEDRVAARVGEDGAERQPGDLDAHAAAVTAQAIVGLPDDPRTFRFVLRGRDLVDRVEDGAEGRVGRGDLEHAAVLHVPDVRVVAVIDRAGRPR